jgi:hypothetical protein
VGEWSSSRPNPFTPGEIDPGTHCIGAWVSPTADLDIMKEKTSRAHSGNRTPAVQPVARHFIDWAVVLAAFSKFLEGSVTEACL